ncbi:hypothetical protein ACE1SV_62850 [Streptomyces sennicomposti]
MCGVPAAAGASTGGFAVCPLASAAIAGTAWPADRAMATAAAAVAHHLPQRPDLPAAESYG